MNSNGIGDCRCLNKLDKYIISDVLSSAIHDKEKKLKKVINPDIKEHIRELVDLRNRIEEVNIC